MYDETTHWRLRKPKVGEKYVSVAQFKECLTYYALANGFSLWLNETAQLVSKFQRIRRCNDYVMLQNIPCSPECKIVEKILLDHSLSYVLTATVDVHVVYLQQFWMTVSKVPDTKDTVKFKLDTQEIIYTTIEAFMNRVGYQGVVDKLFHVVVNRTNVDYAALLWWDFMNCVSQKKDYIQYPRFTKLIIADLIKKYETISPRIEEDYHSCKDDIALGSGPQRKKKKQRVGVTSSQIKPMKVTIKQKKQITTLIPPPCDDWERDEVAEATILSLTLHKTAIEC
ncbi:hypothetical protein Tco_0205670 [Tanacetum coccineum]